MNAVTHVGAVTAEITTHPQAVKSLLWKKKWRAFVWGGGGGGGRRACSYVQREES